MIDGAPISPLLCAVSYNRPITCSVKTPLFGSIKLQVIGLYEGALSCTLVPPLVANGAPHFENPVYWAGEITAVVVILQIIDSIP